MTSPACFKLSLCCEVWQGRALSVLPQVSPAESFAPLCQHKDKHFHPLRLLFPFRAFCSWMCGSVFGFSLSVILCRQQDYLSADSGGDMEQALFWPSTLLWAGWTLPHPTLSSLKDCLLIACTSSNLLSRLPLSETIEVHWKWLLLPGKHHWFDQLPVNWYGFCEDELSRTMSLGFERELCKDWYVSATYWL